MQKNINTKAVTLTLGIVWALYLLVISITAIITDTYAHNVVQFIATIYPDYSLSFMGIVYGVFWAFFDGAIFGFVFSIVYNQVLKIGSHK